MKTQGERPYYVWHAVYLWVFRDIIDFQKKPPQPDIQEIKSTFEKVKGWIEKDERIKVDDFVMDIHTGS